MKLSKDQEEARQREQKYFNDNIQKKDERIDLVTVTYYRREFTKRCLDYLYLRTSTPYRLTVVDNGSKDCSRKTLMKLYKEKRISNLFLLDRNYGLEYARNTALRHLQGEYTVFFDNDLLLPDLEPDWLSQQVDLMKRNPEFGCIALRPQVLVGPPNDLWDTKKEVVEFKHVGATFMMFKTDLIKEIMWDEQFTNRVADWRLGDILKERGLKMGWAKNLFCYHMFNKNWGYPETIEHYHREIWPPPEHYDKVRVNPKTLEPINE